MYHRRHVLCSASCSSPASLLKESGLSCFRVYDGCSGRNSAWMTKRAALFVQSVQCLSSAVMVMMSLMNPFIHTSVAVISTDQGYAIARWLYDCCLSSCGSKDRCGEFISYVSQDSYWIRLFPRSISASLTVVYSAGASVVPKINLRKKKNFSSTIAMHVDEVVAFACIQR